MGNAVLLIGDDKDGGPIGVPAASQTRNFGPDEAVPYPPWGAATRWAGRDTLCASLESFVPAWAGDSRFSPFPSAAVSEGVRHDRVPELKAARLWNWESLLWVWGVESAAALLGVRLRNSERVKLPLSRVTWRA